MKFFALFLVCGSLLLPSIQAESKVYGVWKSDIEKTMQYLREKAKVPEDKLPNLEKFFGDSEVRFHRDGTGSFTMGAREYTKADGTVVAVEASRTEFKFKILGESECQVVIQSVSGDMFDSNFPFSLFKFTDQDSYSVNLSDSYSEVPGREFFRRVGDLKAQKTEELKSESEK